MRALPETLTLDIGLDEPDDAASLRRKAARQLGVTAEELPLPRLVRRSIDARRGGVRFHVVITFEAQPQPQPSAEPKVCRSQPVLIVGDGPAGLFCAYELARAGVGSVVLERGERVQPRRHDIKKLYHDGVVVPDSNYCFGEGGAGTFSDGKLYTRAQKRGNTDDVLRILVAHGAPEDILVDARPHIGSNRLPQVVAGLREHLEQLGVTFRFGAKVVGLQRKASGAVCGVTLANGELLDGDAVVLATGHSARDVFTLLLEAGIALEAKPFAMGVRIEHPQPLVDKIQYGSSAGHPRLPAASYRLVREVSGRGVFSFCMCPGGFIVPASTDGDGLVVNGMSLSRRDSPFANSGFVVSVDADQLQEGPLAGVELQRTLERAAREAGGGGLRAPASRIADLLAGRGSSTLPASSYRPGLTAVDLRGVLDSVPLGLSTRIVEALRHFGRGMKGFDSQEGIAVGVESRTSSPVRVMRDPLTLESPGAPGLIPCGEGAGFAGGILSAALDGIRAAHSLLESRGARWGAP